MDILDRLERQLDQIGKKKIKVSCKLASASTDHYDNDSPVVMWKGDLGIPVMKIERVETQNLDGAYEIVVHYTPLVPDNFLDKILWPKT